MNAIIQEPWVQVTRRANGKCDVRISIGNSTTVRNLKQHMVLPFVQRTIVSAIRRYVNHRQQVLTRHGGYMTPAKQKALFELEYHLGNAQNVRLEKLPIWVNKMLTRMVVIQPGKNSAFYSKYIMIYRDLEAWCHNAMNPQKLQL